ncbi:MAG TPA: sialidase family protein [Vicinamibacterales bacterium]|nr:sialidase family protein [Vicinamibacterales bacterium]
MNWAPALVTAVLVALILQVGTVAQQPASASSAPVLRSSDLGGLRLRGIGPATMSGRFVDMDVVESNPFIMYVASATGGIYRTTDNGITWTPVFEREAVHSVGDVAIYQPDPNIVWVGTGERANRQSVGWGDGVYKTTDGGKTWTNVGLKTSMHIGRIVTHPSDPLIVYVAAQGSVWGAGGERGLYRTMDGGKTWQRTLHVDDDTGVTDVAMDTVDLNVLYAASYQRRRSAFGFNGGGPGSALWKSTDAGATWTKLTGNGLPEGEYGRIGIAVYRKDPRVVIVSIEQGFRYNASTAYTERRGGLYRSNDAGKTWRFMSNWNPRPMYASQPTIDPQDDRRVYMLNQYSYSDNGGETFTSPNTTTHGDDRFVWINPRDSRHVIKLDDGGIGISFDRGLKFLYVQNLPVSQYYRVAVDNERPYNIYGGLQDNGCWKGPSAVWTANGILNEHWSRLCGGDGFFTVPDPTNARHVFSASQFLGLVRNDTRTWQSQDIRPGDPQGAISDRRNWNTWGKGVPQQVLGNEWHYANWDAPVVLSPFDPATIYAGGKHLFRSRDRGNSWEDLGDMTTGVDRSKLPLMGRLPDEHTLSVDDGVPFYPGLVAIAASPLQKGLLYVGSDDGRLRMSTDDGKTWTDLQDRLPGAPKGSWFGSIEASRHSAGTVYVAMDNHRSNDFGNWIFKSGDGGKTFTNIAGDMPANRVVRTIREDVKNPNLLFAGTELGLFFSPNGGANWIELKNNMPTLPHNDLVIHPRDNDLVLGTHGRGIWILDKINALQEMTPQVIASPAHLFTIAPAYQIRQTNLKAHTGDMWFRGENPANGALIDYWLGTNGVAPAVTVHTAAGQLVNTLRATADRGVNRIVWNLRETDLPIRGGGGGDDDAPAGGASTPGPLVAPGTYVVRLAVAGRNFEQKVEVREDPRIDIAPAERKQWTDAWQQVAALAREFAPVNDRIQRNGADVVDLKRQSRELLSRISGLYGAFNRWTGAPTKDQLSRLAYYQQMAKTLSGRAQ